MKIPFEMASPELPFCTYRICNIPPDFDDAALRAIIPLEKDERIMISSISPDYDASRFSSQTGTITWSTTPRQLQGLVSDESTTTSITAEFGLLGDDGALTVRGNEVTVDSHFTGLTPLNPGPENNELAVEYVRVA